MTMFSSIIRYSRRQLHTIVSKEIIKPSSPTPNHLKKYNLSLFDQGVPSTFIPMVTFYPNPGSSSHDKTLALKNSFSQTLAKYYPFAGRHAKTSPAYVDCNDEGAEFLEASVDSTLSDFLQKSQHEDLDQFFPHGRIWSNKSNLGDHDDQVIPLAVQVSHFECGGVAVAASLSHKVADGSSLIHFLNDWARFCSKNQKHESLGTDPDPHFISFQDTNYNFSEISLEKSKDCVTRSFIFPKSKINDLKLKVTSMIAESGETMTNITRVEALTWLLFKCAVAASTKNNAGAFKPTGIAHPVDIRRKMVEPLPENSVGNILITLQCKTNTETELKPGFLIGELKKQKKDVRGIQNIEAAFGHLWKMFLEANFDEQMEKYNDAYICTSMIGASLYKVDFGWGKPVKATTAGNLSKNSFILMDAPNEDDVEALVCLRKEDMNVLQTEPELLAFC